MSAPANRTPAATGDIAQTPVAHLALYLYRKASTGTLVVTGASGRGATVRIEDGRATAARFDQPVTDMLAGLVALCGLTGGRFEFYTEDLLDEATSHSGSIDPYALLTASLREHARDDMVEAVLDRYAGSTLRLQPGRDLSRLALRSDERVLIDLLRAAPAKADDLVAQSPLPAQHARRLVYALIVTHMVAPHEDRSAATYQSQVMPATTTPPRSAPPARTKSDPPVASRRPPQRPVTFTSVNEVASASMPAWQRLAMRASMAPGHNGAPSRRPSSPSIRPPDSLPPDADVPARLEHVDRLLARNRTTEALRLAETLVIEEPQNPQALALKAQVLLARRDEAVHGVPRGAMEGARAALRIDPEHPRALYVKGLVYKIAGDYRKAYNCFRRAAASDPKNLDIQREARLARMRKD